MGRGDHETDAQREKEKNYENQTAEKVFNTDGPGEKESRNSGGLMTQAYSPTWKGT